MAGVQSKPITWMKCRLWMRLSIKYCCLSLRAAAIRLNFWLDSALYWPNQAVNIKKRPSGSLEWPEKARGSDLITATIKKACLAGDVAITRRSRRWRSSSMVWKISKCWAFFLATWDRIDINLIFLTVCVRLCTNKCLSQLSLLSLPLNHQSAARDQSDSLDIRVSLAAVGTGLFWLGFPHLKSA